MIFCFTNVERPGFAIVTKFLTLAAHWPGYIISEVQVSRYYNLAATRVKVQFGTLFWKNVQIWGPQLIWPPSQIFTKFCTPPNTSPATIVAQFQPHWYLSGDVIPAKRARNANLGHFSVFGPKWYDPYFQSSWNFDTEIPPPIRLFVPNFRSQGL